MQPIQFTSSAFRHIPDSVLVSVTPDDEIPEAALWKTYAGLPWIPEEEPYEELYTEYQEETYKEPLELYPSEFTEFAMRIPDKTGIYNPFSFEGRRHMIDIYNSNADRLLLCCARQVEKSTLLGNMSLSYACLVPGHKTLYVSPSATQTKTFSVDRLKDPIETSPILRGYVTRALSQNVFEKQFLNRSKITLRSAYLTPDRARGVPAYCLALDEIQDILYDNIPIIEQCTAHAPKDYKRFIYAGTPKSLDNTIEIFRAQKSTQGEWFVPCDRCGSSAGAGRYWNILGEKNIGLKGLSCERCGKLIDPMHPDAQWAHQVALHETRTPWTSYRIPQLMVPWKDWREVLHDYHNYPRAKFYNEVLGISYDAGTRPLTRGQLLKACNPEVSMLEEHLRKYLPDVYRGHIWAGIDWGGGTDNSYTVLVLGTYVNGRFRIIYAKRFTGNLVDSVPQLIAIDKILKKFGVRRVGADVGMGQYQLDALTRAYGMNRILPYRYFARLKRKIERKPNMRCYNVYRTEVMADIFNAIKRGQIELPKFEEFIDPFGQDLLNIYSEEQEMMHQVVYTHSPDKPDDTFHAILFCFLASMADHPRPDVIAPRREDARAGVQHGSTYDGPTQQLLLQNTEQKQEFAVFFVGWPLGCWFCVLLIEVGDITKMISACL